MLALGVTMLALIVPVPVPDAPPPFETPPPPRPGQERGPSEQPGDRLLPWDPRYGVGRAVRVQVRDAPGR